jgi:hypothetical protein
MGRERIAHRLGWVKPFSCQFALQAGAVVQVWPYTMTRQTGILIVFLAALLLGGCARAMLTNLTVSQQPRDPNGLYRVEIIWENTANGVHHETVHPVVLVGTNSFPMQRTALVSNRWETLLPVAADAAGVAYRVRVDWEFNAIPVPEANSKMSGAFQLIIKDK